MPIDTKKWTISKQGRGGKTDNAKGRRPENIAKKTRYREIERDAGTKKINRRKAENKNKKKCDTQTMRRRNENEWKE